ncbi:FadD3 family acyl-CoA ligase [Pseudomonas sp. TTU2014-080ASC]|uniref:FadD3 family acyl-CoA ligase n=1 Tax=Pseudomonas sp. TTU2014-080ASC TaxID=1729724 RepID=UPI00071842D3|nr:FadD3 family acyl-CoA ligase [Pseudomonas sp. TTU2014-080ASC]KRW58445.1 fatty acid--CoA ligase [Pseudomonas sp. TTU2014-080ASC]
MIQIATTAEQTCAASPATIPAMLFEAGRLHAGRAAIEEDGVATDYADLPALALQVTRALMASGIQHGDRVAVWAPNCRDWIIAALGIHCAGATLVPINTRMKGPEAADILERSGTRVLFVQEQFLGVDYPAMLQPHRPSSLEKQVVINSTKEPAGQDQSWDAFLLQGEAVSEADARQRADAVTSNAICDLLFTSGTTGKPKGVMSAHGPLLRAFREFGNILGLVPGDRYLIVNPFFHAFGYKAGFMSCLLAGVTILPHAVFDAEAVFERIARERVTVLPGPPALYLSMLAHPRLRETDLSSLRAASTGASTIPSVLIERMRRELGFKVVTTAYGLTECGGLATICDPADSAEIIASTSGKPLPGTEVSIRGSDNQPLAQGEVGEICLRGFHVMQGYFDNPEATAQTIDSEGWLHTGDVGCLDEHGNLRITDRLKDMFIVGGFNCYPAEIEAALLVHPGIAQVAVIGVPDERMGEVGCACVVLHKGQRLDEAQLISWSREQMANYKVPRYVRFFEALPLNSSNKVDKISLREKVALA